MSKLTPRQENFCIEYAKDGNASRAYRESYTCENMKVETIKNNAYKLLQNTDIITTIEQMRQEVKDKALWTKEDSIRELQKALSISTRANEVVMVIKELNAMHGYNAPIETKTELNGTIGIAKVIELPKRQ